MNLQIFGLLGRQIALGENPRGHSLRCWSTKRTWDSLVSGFINECTPQLRTAVAERCGFFRDQGFAASETSTRNNESKINNSNNFLLC